MAVEPITLEHVKTHLRLGMSDREDNYLTILISAARRAIENATDRDFSADVPALDDRDTEIVSQASLLLIGQWYANREAGAVNVTELPFAVQWLINPLRIMSV